MKDPASTDRSWDDIKESCDIDNKEQIKFLAQRNFGFFIEHVLGFNTNSPVIQQSIEFHQNPEQFSETDSGTDAVKAAIMAPRGHSKTYSWVVAPILWRAYSEKGKEILLSSASNSQSKDILKNIKRIIERNDALAHLNPSTENMAQLGDTTDIEDWETTWGKEEITTTTDVQIQVKTFSDTIRSSHVDYVFLDDVLSHNMSIDKEKDVFYSVLSPIVENSGGLMQIVGTPLDYDDLMMELIEKDNFFTKRYRACDQDTEEVLWPDQWTYESLMEKKAEIGSARFAREYLTQPMSVQEQFFEEHVIESAIGADWKHNPHDSDHDNWNYYLGVDIALQDGPNADYSVFTVLGKPKEGGVHLVNMEREKGMSPKDIAEKIESLDNFYHFSKGLVEKNAIGEGVWRTIEEECTVVPRVESFDTTRKTRPEILSSLQAAIGRGELVLHDFSPLMREMKSFHMNKKGKLVGEKHDDTVMSLAIAYRVVDGGGAQASFSIIGEDESGTYNESYSPENEDVGAQSSSPDVNIGIV